MKKYFLLIILSIIAFLWLGNNYSFGQCESQCPGSFTATTVDWQIQCTCTPASSPSATVITCTAGGTSVWCICPTGTKSVDNICKPCNTPGVCCGVSLNTNVPFIGKCIENTTGDRSADETSVSWTTAFPVLMWSLTKIMLTLILIISFVLIIIGGIMIATGNPSWGRTMITNVIIGIALLGASWVILRLINPNFFG